METAVLDACVLFSGGVRDFLLWVAEAGAFSPAWSDAIHDEWINNRRSKFNDPLERLQYTRNEMENAFPGANFAPAASLDILSLPDPNDMHVIATAIAAEASTIVTYNVRHFPRETLAQLNLCAEEPDVFCARIFDRAQAEVLEGARLHRSSLQKPRYEPSQYLDHLESGLEFRRTVPLLRKFKDHI